MIFYFTGTGNSEYTARRIAKKTGGEVISISEAIKEGKNKFYLGNGEPLGFVFPVYAFDVPEIVSGFIKNIELENYSGQYVFAVFTCGASTGVTYDNFRRLLADRGIMVKYACDLVMPDNYIILFDPGQPEKQEGKLAAADKAIAEIAEAVAAGTEATVVKGKNPPRFFARLVSYFFNKYAMGTKKFRVTGACTSCGLCEKICPAFAIEMNGELPEWRGERCAKCMGCINRCPVRAIEYGRATKKRSRYVHPTYRDKR